MKRIYLALMAMVGPVVLGSCEGLAELETHLDIAVGEDDEGGGDGDKKGTSIGFGVSVGFGNDGPEEDDAVLEYEDIIPPEIIQSSNVQGGDCWGDFFFQFGTNNTRIRIYDLALKTYSQNVYLSNDLTGFVPNCHCNTVAFGTEYFDAGDPFPLIYVSTGYGVDGYTGALVYRIKRNYLGTFSVSLVQTIKFPYLRASWTEFIPAGEVAYLCYPGERTVYRMEMPKLKDGDLVSLDPSQALETYLFPPRPGWMGTSRNQDYLLRDGKIYFITGTSHGFSGLVVLDLGTRKWERIINFKKNGLTSEPESIFVWQGDICVALKDRIVKLHL
jgi:hypothetical protein